MRSYRARRREVLADVDTAWKHVLAAQRARDQAEPENRRLQSEVEELGRELRAAKREVAELRHRAEAAEIGPRRGARPQPPGGLNRAERRRLERYQRSNPGY